MTNNPTQARIDATIYRLLDAIDGELNDIDSMNRNVPKRVWDLADSVARLRVQDVEPVNTSAIGFQEVRGDETDDE
jgi:hypothetical protein